jgi:hypothetical protein
MYLYPAEAPQIFFRIFLNELQIRLSYMTLKVFVDQHFRILSEVFLFSIFQRMRRVGVKREPTQKF